LLAHNITTKKGVSRLETNILSELSAQGKKIFTIDDVKSEFSLSPEKAKKILFNLNRKNWINRLFRGKYLVIPLEAGIEGQTTEHEFIIASHIVQPYSISYWTALNYHGLTGQIPRVIFLQSSKRVGKRELRILNNIFRVVTIRPYKFFGNRKIWINERQVTITDREKTILDCLDLPQYAGGLALVNRAIQENFRELDFKKINEYVYKLENQTVIKRLGFLCEYYGIKNSYWNKWRKLITSGYGKLDPTKGDTGKFNRRWGLRINTGLE